jgi:transcriptional regulator with XRE-family HTH domain
MPFSPTAKMLERAINASGMTHREIADRVNFKNAKLIAELKSGELRVPLERIPALALALGMDERKFLTLAIEEYFPGVNEVLVETLGLPLSDVELGIVTMFRMASMRGDIELVVPFRTALEALLKLAAANQSSPGK